MTVASALAGAVLGYAFAGLLCAHFFGWDPWRFILCGLVTLVVVGLGAAWVAS